METLRNSYIYAIISAFSGWISRKWNQSILVHWMTNQKCASSRRWIGRTWADKLHGVYCRIFEKLRLARLLQGSIFLHPLIFAAAAVILAPLCPTIVVLALVCASFFSLALQMGVNRQQQIVASPLNIYVILFAFIYLYATLTSVSVSSSLFPGILTVAFILFFFVMTSSGLEGKKLNLFLYGLLAAGVAVSLYGFYQFLFPEQFRNVWTDTDMFSTIAFRIYSTLENPNVLGEYFLLVIPLGFAMTLTADSKPKRIACLAACVLMGICLILTYSRGCYLGILFAALIFLVLLNPKFLIVGVVAIALCPLYLPESVISRFTSIGNMGDTSTSYRVSIWMGTLAMLKDYWFCGVGPGIDAFNMVYPAYAHNAITAPHSHSLYLQLPCESGICGLLVFLLLIIAFYRMMFTAIRAETDKQARIFQIAGVSAVSGFLVQSATDHTFYNYRVLFLFWAVLGLCVLFTRMGRKAPASTSEVDHD